MTGFSLYVPQLDLLSIPTAAVAYLAALRAGASRGKAAKAVGINRATASKWARKFDGFREAEEQAERDAVALPLAMAVLELVSPILADALRGAALRHTFDAPLSDAVIVRDLIRAEIESGFDGQGLA